MLLKSVLKKLLLHTLSLYFFLFFCINLNVSDPQADKKNDLDINKERSIVLIVYSFNCAQKIRNYFESIKNCKNLNIIFIDDCSNDGTETIINKYLGEQSEEFRSKIKVIRNSNFNGLDGSFEMAKKQFVPDNAFTIYTNIKKGLLDKEILTS